MAGLTVGWDLDMTLVDSRPGIITSLDALAAETGAFIDSALCASRLGPPLEEELANWFPADEVDPAADRYRELYGDLGVPGTFALPGAAEAVLAVSEHGGRNIVVTAKYEPNAIACLAQVGISVDIVIGWRHGEAKGVALAEHGAAVYVGDTASDVAGALSAGAVSVGVASGPASESELADAGADVVLSSLVDFAGWFAGFAAGFVPRT